MKKRNERYLLQLSMFILERLEAMENKIDSWDNDDFNKTCKELNYKIDGIILPRAQIRN